jgi:hypothetical protein
MKHIATNTGVIMLALVAVSGVSLFFNFDEIFTPDNKISTSGALMTGNVEVVKRDGAGNIVAYRQGDNHIVLGGMEIIARQVFGNLGGGNNTNSTGFNTTHNFGGGVVQYMEIGNGTGETSVDCKAGGGGPILGYNNVTLECPLYIQAQGDPCLRELAVINRFNATEQPPAPSDAAQLNITAVATFSGATPNSCAADNIGEAGIWTNASVGPAYYINNTAPQLSGNIMFARNTFGTVNLSTSDSLELTWKFTFTDN